MHGERVEWCIPDCREPKALTQRLHDAEVGIFGDERCSTALRFGEVDVCLIYDYNALEWHIVENGSNGPQRD